MLSNSEPRPTNEWRRHVAEALSTVDELLVELELDATASDIVPTSPAVRRFPLRVPRGFVARMRAGDAHDPLLLPGGRKPASPQNSKTSKLRVYEQPADR